MKKPLFSKQAFEFHGRKVEVHPKADQKEISPLSHVLKEGQEGCGSLHSASCIPLVPVEISLDP